MRVTSISSLKKIKVRGLKSLFPSKARISVGLGSCGIAAGAESVYTVLQKEAKKRKLNAVITKTGCLGFCGEEPLINLMKPGSPLVVYNRFT
ncbi:MAG: (2Fe-2S) ferredoxin domain-containing protein, partial [Deltaproteobacteria bacterium]|nr:(2Fe-2S) ferredoxin domain-containing protein [Deltaproteobacteria bacterium]